MDRLTFLDGMVMDRVMKAWVHGTPLSDGDIDHFLYITREAEQVMTGKNALIMGEIRHHLLQLVEMRVHREGN